MKGMEKLTVKNRSKQSRMLALFMSLVMGVTELGAGLLAPAAAFAAEDEVEVTEVEQGEGLKKVAELIPSTSVDAIKVSANALTYNGEEQVLVNAEFPEQFAGLNFSVGTETASGNKAVSDNEAVTAKDAGTYWVWYAPIVADGYALQGADANKFFAADKWVKKVSVNVAQFDVKDATVVLDPEDGKLNYNSNEQTVGVKVMVGDVELTDAEIALSGNTAKLPGKYTIKIDGKGSISNNVVSGNVVGTKTVEWEITGAAVDAMSAAPEIDYDLDVQDIYLVKGQKFTDTRIDKFNYASVDEKTGKVTVKDAKSAKADKKIVVVGKGGKITAKKAGDVVLSNPTSANKIIKVHVVEPKVTTKTLKDPSGDLTATISKNVVIAGTYAANYNKVYASSNPAVVTVSDNTLVLAGGKGTAVVTTYINGKAYKTTVKSTKEANAYSVYVNTDGKLKLKGANKKASWTGEAVSNNIVNAKGQIKKPNKPGKYVAELKEGTKVLKTVTIYVENPTPSVSGDNATTKGVLKGSKNTYEVKMTIDRTNKNGIWKSAVDFDLGADMFQDVVFASKNAAVVYDNATGQIIARDVTKNAKGKDKPVILSAKINKKNIKIKVSVDDAPAKK